MKIVLKIAGSVAALALALVAGFIGGIAIEHNAVAEPTETQWLALRRFAGETRTCYTIPLDEEAGILVRHREGEAERLQIPYLSLINDGENT